MTIVQPQVPAPLPIGLQPLPQGPFGAILADPPWAYVTWSNKSDAAHGVPDYNQMNAGDIGAMDVGAVAAETSVLFLWATWPTLPDAMQVIERWGFTYKTCAFCWLKGDPYRLFALEEDIYMGLGHWTRANSEPCLLATKGSPKRLNADVRQGILAPRREHSRKPDCVHERIERLVAGPYLELFARQTRPGWESWGNETTKFNAGGGASPASIGTAPAVEPK